MSKNEENIVHFVLDPDNPPRFTDEQRARLEAMPLCEDDPENPPLTDEEFARMEAAVTVRRVRAQTGLSQSAFAERFRINLGRLRDLEQGRTRADSALTAYLKVIAKAPAIVDEALRA